MCSGISGGGHRAGRGALPAGDRRDAGRIRVECERAPERLHAPGSTIVRCFAELDTERLLHLRRAAGERPVELVDRGWCPTCPAGSGDTAPGFRARARVSALLADMGLAALAPRLVREASSAALRDDSADRRRARRGFLHRLAHPGSTDVPADDPAAKRATELALLAELGAAHGVSLPARAFPALQVSGQCRDHGVCVAVCPARALGRYAADGLRGIEFTAARCTACGACGTACPEHAITLAPDGDGRVPAGAARLTAHQPRICARCDDEFVSTADGDDLCPGCRKDEALFTAGPIALRLGGRTEHDRPGKEL